MHIYCSCDCGCTIKVSAQGQACHVCANGHHASGQLVLPVGV